MTIEERVILYMNTKHPEKKSLEFTSGFVNDPAYTHESFAKALEYAKPGTQYYRDCLDRCYLWLVKLKENDIKLIDNVSP